MLRPSAGSISSQELNGECWIRTARSSEDEQVPFWPSAVGGPPSFNRLGGAHRATVFGTTGSATAPSSCRG
eukprot:12018102-Alexandrium_andersonii.AAC.1